MDLSVAVDSSARYESWITGKKMKGRATNRAFVLLGRNVRVRPALALWYDGGLR